MSVPVTPSQFGASSNNVADSSVLLPAAAVSTSGSALQPPLLCHAMRRLHNMPLHSPLHPMSNATHRIKRWSQEMWIERAT
jgi:hypothetical protein